MTDTQTTLPTTPAPRTRKPKQPEVGIVTDVTLPKRDLVSLVSRVASVANPKSPHPMMKLTLLRAEAPRLHAMATDGYTSIATYTDAIVAKAGAIAVDGKDLLERAKAMPDGSVRMTINGDGHVSLTSEGGKLSFKMSGVLAADYPRMASSDGAEKTLAMKGSELDALFRRVLFAVAEPGARVPSITGMHVYGGDGVLTLEGSDGNMLTRVRVESDVRRRFRWLIPKKCVAQILASCVDGDGLVEFSESGGERSQVFVSAGGGSTTLAVALLGETFPNVDGFLPKPGEQAGLVTVGRAALADSIRAVSVAAALSYIEFAVDGKLLAISTKSAERGEADDELEVMHAGPDARFGLSAANAIDILGALGGDNVAIGFDLGADGPDWRPTPVTVRVVGDESGSAALLMPMRTDYGATRDQADADKKGKGK